MFEQFTRQPESTHCVVYGNGAGELLVSYWASEGDALDEATSVLLLAQSEGFDAHPRIESLAKLDALETGGDDTAGPPVAVPETTEQAPVQRHAVVAAAEANGWSRAATPNFDVFNRRGTEVEVFYYETGRVQGARIGSTDRAYRTPAGPRGKLETVLAWLQAPGEPESGHTVTIRVHTGSDSLGARMAVNRLLDTPSPEQWAEILGELSDDSFMTLDTE